MFNNRQLHLETGTPIVSLDGKHIGKVKEVRDTYVKVDARWRRDYWITFDEILSADREQALLVIPADEVNLYKMSKPGHLSRLAGDEVDLTASRRRFDREMLGR